MPSDARPLRGLTTWISRQSKNALESAQPELADQGIRIDLVHYTADPRSWRRVPIAWVKYVVLLLRVITVRYDFLLVNPGDAWLRRPNALRGLLAAARLRRVPVMARWGNPDWIYRHKTTQMVPPEQFERACRSIVEAAVTNLVLTRHQGREVQHWVGFEKMDVIGNCKRVADEWLEAPRVPRPGGLVVNVASVQPLKGPDLFVRVAREITSTTHPDAKFLWVGGIATPDIEALIDELDVRDSVEFRRRVFPPYPLLQDAAVMFFPSRSESLSLAVAEAMACGLPVCCFDGTGTAEVLGPCGIVIPQESVAEAADAIRSYLDRRDHDEISRVSRAHYAANFTPAPFAEHLAAIIRRRLDTSVEPEPAAFDRPAAAG